MTACRIAIAAASLLIASLPEGSHAQTVSPPSSLEQDVADLRQEVARLRDELVLLKQSLASPASAPAALQAGVEVVQAQIAEQAQVKVESQSRLPVKIFGTIHSSTFLNRGAANWLENPNLVAAGTGDDRDRSFSSTLRQSRIGFLVDGATVGAWRVNGVLALDFFGGAPGFQTGQVMGLPRLLYGFARFESGNTAIEVGQDQMIVAPRDPSSLASPTFPALYRAGNLYLRVPQARVERRVATGRSSALTLAAGIVAPIAGDFAASYTFVPPALSGEQSGSPAAQARVAWSAGDDTSTTRAEIGIGGHYGRRRDEGGTRTSWATVFDLDLRFGRVGVGSEFYTGDQIAAFGGAIGQQARSHGGYVEGRLALSSRLAAGGGFGLDRIADWSRALVPLGENEGRFGNLTYHFTPEVAAAFEYRWLITTPVRGEPRRNHHTNWTLAYSF
jgi:hypothetical protein